METGFYFHSVCCFLIFFSKASTATDTISPSESLTDGMTLVSNGGSFALGFFSPDSSTNRYLGIWYNNIPMQTVVWVANRVNPVNDSTGVLKIESSGRIVLQVQNITAVWSTNRTASVENPVLQLLDSGNLVVRDGNDGNPEKYLWQSFDYPSDTMLPGMKIGVDLTTGFDRRLSTWKNWDDPSPGDLTYGVELEGSPQMVLRKGLQKYSLSGLWIGNGFSGAPNVRLNPIFYYDFVWNENEVYYTFLLKNKSVMSRIGLNQIETARERVQSEMARKMELIGLFRRVYTHEAIELPERRWVYQNSQRENPDTTNSWVNKTMNLKECREKCLRNCSCMAYTNLDISTGNGCAMWFGDLIDIKQLQSEGLNLYIRVSASETDRRKKANVIAIILATVIVAFLGILLVVCYICRRMRKLKDEVEDKNLNGKEIKDENEDMELAVFEFGTIAQATDSFSFRNKLGEGGFGPVFKGTLANGQEVAVKRLSKSSGQGLNEFKTEVKLIAKLQHRNLVRLLGCCAQGDERMLVYEYMPNRSLDSFIFDQSRREVLTWSMRFRIICGIARGLLYLHQDSRLRIIHRDLKASNVLLDSEMNPKISDFGLARTFGGDETEASTNRVVGTYGYMAPEYATDGLFSVKSDVFSFGIVLLEVISGRKNRGFYHENESGNLIQHAWRLWKEAKPLDVADDFLVETGDLSELLRCIHISLLCVQTHQEERPSMSSVVHMLGSQNELPTPKQPSFLYTKKRLKADSSPGIDGSSSRNEISLSLFEAR
ncbi:S-locus lectin protein kinase family protein [Hibiscus syriacus]|uniref:Receptor-like serine/threonine-protein kinase n=1 Tax=Hibiscus syriacus TaxID=106335 RepID=A0A6A2WYV7_HIBSY|nr:S-locus lectin protein kinase family protein [Hibiscus syriacus]